MPLRNLWELLIDIKNRPKWDSMCYATEDIEEIGLTDQSEAATRQATVSYLATKGMFPGKTLEAECNGLRDIAQIRLFFFIRSQSE